MACYVGEALEEAIRQNSVIRAEILGFGVTEVETALEAAGLSE